jgi:hypothetical protein
MYMWADAAYDPNSTAQLTQYAAQDIDNSQLSGMTNVSASASHTSGATRTGLTAGQKLTVSCNGFVVFGLKAANAGNLAALSVLGVFTR